MSANRNRLVRVINRTTRRDNMRISTILELDCGHVVSFAASSKKVNSGRIRCAECGPAPQGEVAPSRKFEWEDKIAPIKVMAVVDNWVLARRHNAAPFVIHVDEFTKHAKRIEASDPMPRPTSSSGERQ